jgi:hypothetical protein
VSSDGGAANIHQRSCQCSPRHTTTARQMDQPHPMSRLYRDSSLRCFCLPPCKRSCVCCDYRSSRSAQVQLNNTSSSSDMTLPAAVCRWKQGLCCCACCTSGPDTNLESLFSRFGYLKIASRDNKRFACYSLVSIAEVSRTAALRPSR